MPLSDSLLESVLQLGELVITPAPSNAQIQPASIDLRLGPDFLYWDGPDTLDLGVPQDLAQHYKRASDTYLLRPGEFILAATLESVKLSPRLCAHFDGRSTLGRLGLIVHVTAGFCDPGFEGNITLEIKNVASYAMRLHAGMGIGQLIVDTMEGPVVRPYGSSKLNSKYGGVQSGPVPPQLKRKL